MNYGKSQTHKRLDKLKRDKKKTGKRFAISFIETVFVFIIILIASFIGGFYIYASSLVKKLPDVSKINISPEGYSTTIYDKDGSEIDTLAASGANRQYVTIDEIPKDLQHAFVAIEDERFYDHNGIDMKGIIRAGFSIITSGGKQKQGASTITQQLLKNNYFTGWTSESTIKDQIDRKIQEQYLAVQLEKVTDKDTILENYLNTINLGQNTLGVEAAAERYFNKDVKDLTLSEDAVIAGITQNPSKYNPISNPENNKSRRKKVLKNMLDQGYIKKSQYKEALADDVYSRIQIVNNEMTDTATTYFVDALTDQVKKDLMEQKGIEEADANRLLYSGGLKIYSTLDPSIQAIVDDEVNKQENYDGDPQYSMSFRLTIEKADGTFENYSEQTMKSYYSQNNNKYSLNFSTKEDAEAAYEQYKSELLGPGDKIPDAGESITYTLQPEVAMTIIDQSTGHVVALTGGRGDKTASKTLNRATDITRQPGSTFKIVAAYAPALDAGGLTLASVQDDCPTSYTNGTPLHNYDNHYRGYTNIRTGITYSINVVAVKTLTQIGTGLGLQYAQNLGISTLESGDNNQALALGGITNGVKNIELTGAYACIANGGVYHRPVLYTKVISNTGEVLLDSSTEASKQVLKDSTAWLLTSAMKDVMNKGTGRAANFTGQAVAGKSGTTTDDKDTVFEGFTPYYTCGIWGGYDDNTKQSKTSYSKRIWKAVMTRIHENLEYKDFEMPSSITSATVCSKSGLLPLEGVCDSDPRGSMLYNEYFAAGTVPKDTCDHHTRLDICSASNLPAGPYCPADQIISSVFIVGAEQGSDDSPYTMSQDQLSATCNVHTEAAPAPESTEATNPAPVTTEQPTTTESGAQNETTNTNGGNAGTGTAGGTTTTQTGGTTSTTTGGSTQTGGNTTTGE